MYLPTHVNNTISPPNQASRSLEARTMTSDVVNKIVKLSQCTFTISYNTFQCAHQFLIDRPLRPIGEAIRYRARSQLFELLVHDITSGTQGLDLARKLIQLSVWLRPGESTYRLVGISDQLHERPGVSKH